MTGVSEIGQNTTIKVWRGHAIETQETQEEEQYESGDGGDDNPVVGTISYRSAPSADSGPSIQDSLSNDVS